MPSAQVRSEFARVVDYAEPHIGRMRKILATHPEVRTLFGPVPSTVFWCIGIAALQLAVAVALVGAPWWAILLAAYTVGAVSNHACFVLIHEAAHNLIMRTGNGNRIAGIIANFPIIFPSAISFRKYHLIHHRHQGELDLDADLPSPWEARLIGKSAIRKTLWLLFFFVFEGAVRPGRLKSIKLFDPWTVFNIGVEVALLGGLSYVFGPVPFTYLFLSTAFSIGLHPLGARWIQEHYLIPGHETQETYSYYGAANKITFNVGHHNEHHDLVMVPWMKLPKLKAMAPEFYEPLHAHYSWTALLIEFITNPKINLFSRTIRDGKARAANLGKTESTVAYRAEAGLDNGSAPAPSPVAPTPAPAL